MINVIWAIDSCPLPHLVLLFTPNRLITPMEGYHRRLRRTSFQSTADVTKDPSKGGCTLCLCTRTIVVINIQHKHRHGIFHVTRRILIRGRGTRATETITTTEAGAITAQITAA